MEKLDAICMQLIAIGESVKNLDKVTAGVLLANYPEFEWKRVMGLRDILSHHYFESTRRLSSRSVLTTFRRWPKSCVECWTS